MIQDILTVMWKERKGLLYQRGSRNRGMLTMLIPAILVAIWFPWQFGYEWLVSPWSFITSFLVPVVLVGMTVPESFAGERERHTIETLLASRLPDRSILFGKIGISVMYAWGMALVVLMVALVTVNAVHWDGQFRFYAASIFLGNVVFSLLMAALVSNLGVLISLRSSTVQGAAQALMFVFLVPSMLLGIVPFILLRAVPDGGERAREVLGSLDLGQALMIAGAILLVLNAGLLWAAIARFKRARLILD